MLGAILITLLFIPVMALTDGVAVTDVLRWAFVMSFWLLILITCYRAVKRRVL